MKENQVNSSRGIPVLTLVIIFMAIMVVLTPFLITSLEIKWVAIMVLSALISAFTAAGLYKVEPNQSAVLSLFGKYIGTVKESGLRWNNPFYTKRKVSLRVRNFESGKLTPPKPP